MSTASSSSNSIALRISTRSSSPIPPPACASSTMVSSSSSVIPGSSSDLKMCDSSFFHCANTKLTGVRIFTRTAMIGAENSANLSGDSFAMLFGEISPKIKTRTVVTIVETLAPFASPSIFTNRIVAKEEDKIFTILFPIRIVDNRLSYFSSSSSTSAARLFPLSAIFFMRIRFSDKNAVSVAEKYADMIRHIAIMIKNNESLPIKK